MTPCDEPCPEVCEIIGLIENMVSISVELDSKLILLEKLKEDIGERVKQLEKTSKDLDARTAGLRLQHIQYDDPFRVEE